MPKWVENMLWISEAITFPIVILVLIPGFVWLFHNEIRGLLERSALNVPWFRQANVPSQKNAVAISEPDGAERRRERENAQNQELQQALFVSRIETAFERVYRVIYGSQMKALMELSTTPTGLAREGLSKHIPLGAIIANVMTFEQWIGYLERTGLVETQGQIVVISEIGKQFLLYVERQQYAELGPYPNL